MAKKKLVVLSGAGISAESGIPTFRDADGLWEGHDVMEVATPQGWKKNTELVLKFYNERRKAAKNCKPNQAHKILAELESEYDVHVITQNVDDLHERGGSTKVMHLHGELMKVRSSLDESMVFDISEINSNGWELRLGDKCPKGSQLRPHIVWFGEAVPLITEAAKIATQADVFVVVGTSMLVYPAAGLIEYVDSNVPKFIIDPNTPTLEHIENLTAIPQKATAGMKALRDVFLKRL